MKTHRSFVLCTALAVLVTGMLVGKQSVSGESEKAESSLVYELRTYTTAEGRLPALQARFRDHTMQLFEKHGIKNIAYWTPQDKENTLVYVIAHQSRDAAKASWAGFIGDPEWKKVYKESREDGPIVTKVVRQYLTPTDYSPMK